MHEGVLIPLSAMPFFSVVSQARLTSLTFIFLSEVSPTSGCASGLDEAPRPNMDFIVKRAGRDAALPLSSRSSGR